MQTPKTYSITIAEPAIGSIDWELPSRFSANLAQLTKSGRQEVLQALERLMNAQAHVLMLAVQLGEDAEPALDVVELKSQETMDILKRAIKS